MSDTRNTKQDDAQDHSEDRPGSPPVVPLGIKMPGQARKMPVLGGSSGEGQSGGKSDDSSLSKSEIADGLNFEGNAVLTGVCTVKGRVQGNLTQAADAKITVVVTETGHVKGDIVADQISVMGRTEGLLDATGGSVSLHDSANVSGHVRYFRLQVNGSDLNATLERAPAKSSGAPSQAAPAIVAAPPPVETASSAPTDLDPDTGMTP